LLYLLYLSDFAEVDSLLSLMLKRVLTSLTLSQGEFKIKWEGVIETLTKDDCTMTFKKWLQGCK
jgi:hypothetical protein